MKNRTLKFDLLSNLIVSTLFTTIIIILFISVLLSTYIKREQQFKNDALSNAVNLQIESYFTDIENALKGLQDVLFTYEMIQDSNKDEYMVEFLEVNQNFSEVYLLDLDGKVMKTYPQNMQHIGLDYSNFDYFKTAKSKPDHIIWSNIFYEHYTKNPLATVSLKSDSVVLVGVLCLENFSKLVDSINVDVDNMIAITDSTGTYFAHTDQSFVDLREKDPYITQMIASGDFSVKKVRVSERTMFLSATYFEDAGWSVLIFQSTDSIKRQIAYNIAVILVIALVALALSLYFTHHKVTLIAKRLLELAKGTQIISQGVYDYTLEESKYVELNELSRNFKTMSAEIQNREAQIKDNKEEMQRMNQRLENLVYERTLELEKSNMELAQTIIDLKHTQNILIQSEKMASLGQLVAGVTHEMMTPIGSIVTLCSYMVKELEQIEADFTNQHLSKSELELFFKDQMESLLLITNSAQRTKEFVSSLKKTSVDQVSMEKREFEICSTVEDVIRSMKVTLKNSNVSVDHHCQVDKPILSYPGAITQILLNLMNNAIKHAFIDRATGKVTITTSLEGSTVTLVIYDDGIGMTPEVRKRLFEPFFTTARDQGGSGLGMSIIENLVTTLLGGTITCDSKLDKGTSYTITFGL
ncbi:MULTISPECIES: sensor histidine kinase [unclassified Fusibacter]|uniref:sensor histidine kinase n=1 Tax=unclassified Fusibacter TaxID=2624464 RepID=UPI001011A142|nr:MULTISPECIES: sensor histidine kinase [unclassified Fusibacter]MCK8060041.1 sensor histidine kinase [Fusibacter sp. A2]NPE22183.1 sensor histidine kinase [Fusibacter sp. A1]RXV60959.1 hypothetical protein DWB64_10080 [Fusibacter sp. A1]